MRIAKAGRNDPIGFASTCAGSSNSGANHPDRREYQIAREKSPSARRSRKSRRYCTPHHAACARKRREQLGRRKRRQRVLCSNRECTLLSMRSRCRRGSLDMIESTWGYQCRRENLPCSASPLCVRRSQICTTATYAKFSELDTLVPSEEFGEKSLERTTSSSSQTTAKV
jgi:hypothetical protein